MSHRKNTAWKRRPLKMALRRLENSVQIVSLSTSMKKDTRNISISKFMSLVLRHSPRKFGLDPDPKGFVPLDDLSRVLKNRFPDIDRREVEEIVEKASKERFEIKEGKIRARYGHSFWVDLDLKPFIPPEFLYHGTAPGLEKTIKKEGLRPMGREFVHLSKTAEEAVKVGRRKSKHPLLFKVSAWKAHQKGIQFFDRGLIVLVKYVPPEFLTPLGSQISRF